VRAVCRLCITAAAGRCTRVAVAVCVSLLWVCDCAQRTLTIMRDDVSGRHTYRTSDPVKEGNQPDSDGDTAAPSAAPAHPLPAFMVSQRSQAGAEGAGRAGDAVGTGGGGSAGPGAAAAGGAQAAAATLAEEDEYVAAAREAAAVDWELAAAEQEAAAAEEAMSDLEW
jgi:hypothetical protein